MPRRRWPISTASGAATAHERRSLTPDRILDAAEETLTRFGPQKTTVVDVARALGVSHGSVYRHFASKAALRDAVTGRWLDRVSAPLQKIVAEDAPAPERLRRWFDTPDRHQAAEGQGGARAVRHLPRHLRRIARGRARPCRAPRRPDGAIVADGIARGEFADCDPTATGRAIFHATARFHDPAYATEWNDPGLDAAFDDLWALIARGLGPPRRPRDKTGPRQGAAGRSA